MLLREPLRSMQMYSACRNGNARFHDCTRTDRGFVTVIPEYPFACWDGSRLVWQCTNSDARMTHQADKQVHEIRRTGEQSRFWNSYVGGHAATEQTCQTQEFLTSTFY